MVHLASTSSVTLILSYRIYSNKRRGAYLIFRATSAALIRGRRLFQHYTRQIYFFYIFIHRYTFCLLIFLWTGTKLIVNLELREKLTQWKKTESFMITRVKISAVGASGVRHLFEGGAYRLFCPRCGAYSRAALNRGRH